MSTKSQRMAHSAYTRVEARRGGQGNTSYRKEYRGFAREFPTLVHQCGLAQAVAFAQTRKDHHADYANDLAAVLTAAGHANVTTLDALANSTRSLPVAGYVRLSRDALAAALWLKRYVEALFDDSKPEEKK